MTVPRGIYVRRPGLKRNTPGRPATDRFWSKVDKAGSIPEHRPDLGPCWMWTAARTPLGYGRFNRGKRVGGSSKWDYAHRWAYTTVAGPIPEGLHLDHLCRNPPCVNPIHLEPVTPKENVRRGVAVVPRVCIHGEEDRYYRKDRPGRWNCRQCARDRRAAEQTLRKP